MYATKHLILGQVFLAYSNSAGEGSPIFMLGLVWHPVGLAQPDHAAAQGQPATEPVRVLPGSAPGLPCGSPWGRSAGCHTLPTSPSLDSVPWPSRRPARPARARFQVDKLFWGPSKAEVHAEAAVLHQRRYSSRSGAAGRTCIWFELGNRGRAR